MPKIEAGLTSASFLIDGRPYPTSEYTPKSPDNDPASTTAKISIVPTQSDVSIASAPLSEWTDDNDAGFTTLGDFWTYLGGFFFRVTGGGGAVDSVFGRTGAVTAQSGDYTHEQVGVSDEALAGAYVTGVLTGCEVTTNVDTTKYNVAEGTVLIVDWTDPSDPKRTPVIFAGVTGVTPPDASLLFTANGIDINGNLVHAGVAFDESGAFFTNAQERQVACIQTAITNDGVNVTPAESLRLAYEVPAALIDHIQNQGVTNSGNQFVASTSTTIQKQAGTSSGLFINAVSDPQDPTPKTNAAIPTVSWFGNSRDGSGGFNVGVPPVSDLTAALLVYDSNAVSLTTMSNNKYQVKRIAFFGTNDVTAITYGQDEYNSMAEARAAIFTENPTINPQLAQATFLTALIHKKGADLLNPNEAEFIPIAGQSLGPAMVTHAEDFLLGVINPQAADTLGWKVLQSGGELTSVVASAEDGTSAVVTANYSATSGGAKTQIATGTVNSGTDLTMVLDTSTIPAGSFVSVDVGTVTLDVKTLALNFLF